MVQTMDMDQLRIENIKHVCDPQLFNYGKMRDYCDQFSYSFHGGYAYGLIGECVAGGWTVSYILSGRTAPINGSIFVNNKEVNSTMLNDFGWYIGDDLNNKQSFFAKIRSKTVRQQILEGLKKNNNQNSLDEITELFGLSATRLDRPIDKISNERWNASAAIGFSLNRKIYCFPWLNQYWIKKLELRISVIISVLKNNGAIIILPTNKEDSVRHLVDTIVTIPEPSN